MNISEIGYYNPINALAKAEQDEIFKENYDKGVRQILSRMIWMNSIRFLNRDPIDKHFDDARILFDKAHGFCSKVFPRNSFECHQAQQLVEEIQQKLRKAVLKTRRQAVREHAPSFNASGRHALVRPIRPTLRSLLLKEYSLYGGDV